MSEAGTSDENPTTVTSGLGRDERLDVLDRVYQFRWRTRITATGQVAELDAIVTRADLWSLQPEATDPEWSVSVSGPVALALRIVC